MSKKILTGQLLGVWLVRQSESHRKLVVGAIGFVSSLLVGLAVPLTDVTRCVAGEPPRALSEQAFKADRFSCPLPGRAESASYLLLRPGATTDRPHAPLLIFLYGAGGSSEDYNLERAPYDRLRQLLANRGYYVLVPELGPNHCMNADARDILDGIVSKVCAEHPVDPAQVHIMGTSMGGGSALAYTIHRPQLIRSVCSLMGMTDFAAWYAEREGVSELLDKVFHGSPNSSPEPYRQVSAMAHLDAFEQIPVFLAHGDRDETVQPRHSRQLAEALTRQGNRVVYHSRTDVGHEDRVVEGLAGEIVAFLDEAGAAAPPARSQRLSSYPVSTQHSPVGAETVLLVDDYGVLYRPGTKRVLHPLTRHQRNPMLKVDKPWEGTVAYCSVYRDPKTGHYRLWYQAWPGCYLCYATSADGVRWTKPNIGLVDYQGSKENNILLRVGFGAGVLLDPRDPDPERRYKFAYWEHFGTSVAFSADGIHWNKYDRNPVIKGSHGDYIQPPLAGDPRIAAGEVGGPPLSTSDVIDPIWDPIAERYVIYAKTWLDGPDGTMHWKRAVVRTESKDFIHWTKPVLVVAPDEHDDPAGESSLTRDAGGGGTGRKQLHSGPAFVYNNMYFATLQVLDAAVSGNMPIELALSHDGYHWQRPFRDAMFVPPLADKTIIDASLIWSNATPVFLKDEFRFYYGAYGHPWNSADPEQISGVALATMPRDRFAGVRPTETIGQVTLKALDLTDKASISINADATTGSVRLEILNEAGYRMPGFTRDEAVPMTSDDLRHVAAWQDKSLAELPSGRYRLRLHLENAEVFAVTIKGKR